MSKIAPFLWFDNNLEEAIDFYKTVFRQFKVSNISRMAPGSPAFSASFEIEGQEFYALNGGPQFKFNEAVSFFINCEGQQEVDELWDKLSEGGSKGRCGWLKDKFGLSWQVIPTALGKLMGDKDPKKSKNVVQAMMQMTKIEINKLEEAYAKE